MLKYAFILFCCFFVFVTDASARLNVRAAILYNMTTGRVLYEQNADARIPPASLTKVVSMYVALDAVKENKIKLNNTVRVSNAAAGTGGSRMHLRAGERISLEKLLQGMAVASGNDASMAVAQRIATSSRNFVRLMNRKAKDCAMRNSTFKNPHGLPAKGQYTTARDMLHLSRYYLRKHGKTAMRFHSLRTLQHNGYLMTNTNRLLGTVQGVDGLKTGWTVDSGYNLIFTAKRGKTRLLGVVMGGSNRSVRDAEAKRLLEAGFANPKAPKNVARKINGR